MKAILFPFCGSKLVIRKSKYGRFYGCPNFPACRFATNSKFPQLKSFVKKYFSKMTEELKLTRKDYKELIKNMKELKTPLGFVYVTATLKGNLTKIGSSKNILNRLAIYGSSDQQVVKFILQTAPYLALEHFLHFCFQARLKSGNEWFNLTQNEIHLISEVKAFAGFPVINRKDLINEIFYKNTK